MRRRLPCSAAESRVASIDRAQPMGFLVFPTATVRASYLEGERATSQEEGVDLAWLDRAAADFDGFVARLAAPTNRWGVPVTQLWYVDGPTYIGTVMIRHELTAALARTGGLIGYHDHARRMLADALVYCAHFGPPRILVTCEQSNVASRKVIEANGGQPDGIPDGIADGDLRYWITTPPAAEHLPPERPDASPAPGADTDAYPAHAACTPRSAQCGRCGCCPSAADGHPDDIGSVAS